MALFHIWTITLPCQSVVVRKHLGAHGKLSFSTSNYSHIFSVSVKSLFRRTAVIPDLAESPPLFCPTTQRSILVVLGITAQCSPLIVTTGVAMIFLLYSACLLAQSFLAGCFGWQTHSAAAFGGVKVVSSPPRTSEEACLMTFLLGVAVFC